MRNVYYFCTPSKEARYRGRVARLSSAKAATAVRIRSIPQQKIPLTSGGIFF